MSSSPENYPNSRLPSWFIAALGTTLLSLATAAITPVVWEWLLLPVTMAGILVGVDAVDWARKRLDVFDPQGILGVYGFFFFYLAPLGHVISGYWPRYVPPASNWVDALTAMAWLNLIGLVAYRTLVRSYQVDLASTPDPRLRAISPKRAATVAGIGVIVSASSIGVLVVSLGGPQAYWRAVSSQQDALVGYGWLLIVGESLPLFAFIAAAVLLRDRLRANALLLWTVLAATALLLFAVAGVRGARGNTIWPLLVALAVTHLFLRPIRRWTLLVVGVAITAFMFLYGIYKTTGIEGYSYLARGLTVFELSDRSGRDGVALILGDYGRTGAQALVADRIASGSELLHGATYLGDVAVFIPGADLTGVVTTKVEAATDVIFGQGASQVGRITTQIYGLAGEAALNFGLAAVPLSFLILAALVRAASAPYRSAQRYALDPRSLYAGTLALLVTFVLFNDLDNVIYFFAKGVAPVLVVAFLGRELRTTARPTRRIAPSQSMPLRVRSGGGSQSLSGRRIQQHG